MNFHRMIMIVPCWLILAAVPAAAEYKNHCHDAAADSSWNALVNSKPDDYELRHLRDLRASICRRIDSGELLIEDGIKQFEVRRRELVADRAPVG